MNAPQETVEETPSTTPTRKQKWLRRLRNVAITGAVCGVLFLLFLWTCFADPPELNYTPAILQATVQVDAKTGRATLGKSWFMHRPGASLLYVEGDPFTIGYTNASLTADLLEHQERALIETVRAFFPSGPGFLSIATLVLINNRSLPDFVPEEYQYEILGLSRGSPDPYPEYGPRYHRILNYHAAHDISHWVWDKPVVGCTAFAASGATTGGPLLIGRNFDFEAGGHFDTNKIIGLYRPERGHAFLSVSWPGMAGAVTGINDERIYCSINGAHSADKGRIGTPVSLVVRQVLQYAGSLEEAVSIIEKAEVFVTDSFLVADGETGQAVVVEKSPAQVAVRDMAEDGLLFQANHFEAPAFAQDLGNLQHQKEGTTCSRHQRLVEVVRERVAGGAVLDPAIAVAILRDRRAPGGVEVAPGNRSTINPFIATHSVVCDLTQGILWVSSGPHQLGAFEAYTIEGFGGAPPAAEIAADPALADGSYGRLTEARRLIEGADEDPVGRLDDVTRALELNPNDPHALELLGRAAELQDDPARALKHYQAALSAHPAFPSDRQALEAKIRLLQK